ncbi:MAG: hypothetical protein KAW49_09950, partial [Anaerolineae bacterium]|nr:hypothetical protein [Anaerolineae bacterium]
PPATLPYTPMTRCTATTRRGTQCKNSAVPGTNPPRCSIPSHQVNSKTKPKRKRAGAPPGNKNAEKHGAYSRPPAQTSDIIANITNAIADLQQKREQLSRYIDDNQDSLKPLEYAKMLDLLGRLDSRIARLNKQLQELTGEGADKMEADMDAVLAVLSTAFDINLTGKKK